jgi:hypothetical protein
MRIEHHGEVGKKREGNDRLAYNLKGWESNAGERVKVGKGARVGSLNGHKAGHHNYPPCTVYVD